MAGPIYNIKIAPVTALAAARIARSAPPHPPCWDSQEDWVDYLMWCAGSNELKFDPFMRSRDERGRRVSLGFNKGLAYCEDCTLCYQLTMRAKGRCQPGWLNFELWRNRDVVPSCDEA
jgi:hypothetical protein